MIQRSFATTVLATAIALATLPQAASAQATITLVGQDAPGLGLNDTRAAAPIGGNPGRTLGEQRTIAYQYAMDLWGALLTSTPEIRVQASFAPLNCTANGNTLAQAGSIYTASNFPNAPFANISYPASLANALAGVDLDANRNEINTAFNADLATPRCGNGREWYYGLKGNPPVNAGPNFLNVIMHEIAHGLGMSGGTSVAATLAQRNPYSRLAFSRQANASINDLFGQTAQFQAAIGTPWDIVWTGPRANAAARLIADPRRLLRYESADGARDFIMTPASFGQTFGETFPAGDLVLVRDRVAEGAAPTSQACTADGITNAEQIRGNVALIDRGTCEFGLKALNAQLAGAIAVIVIDNTASPRPLAMGPGAAGEQVTIPVLAVSRESGLAMRGEGVSRVGGLTISETQLHGQDEQNRTYLYSDTDFRNALGSVLAHWDPDMAPNALMEPFETPTLRADTFVDIALDMYEDIGWPVNRNGTASLGDCDTGIPVVRDGGFIPGANLIAQQRLCRVEAGTSRAKYQQCMNTHALWLRDQGLISNGEVASVRQCVARQPLASAPAPVDPLVVPPQR